VSRSKNGVNAMVVAEGVGYLPTVGSILAKLGRRLRPTTTGACWRCPCRSATPEPEPTLRANAAYRPQ